MSLKELSEDISEETRTSEKDNTAVAEDAGEKLFTQQELDKIISQRLKREEKRIAEDINALKEENAALAKEISQVKMLNEALKKGLDEKNAQYAVFLAEKMTEAKEGLSFTEALDLVIEENHILKAKSPMKTGLKQAAKVSPQEETASKLAGIFGVKM